jgi:DNA-binding NtrC family response regulator
MTEKKCILLVGDEESDRTELSRNLTSRGYHVMTAGSGEEALMFLRNISFDIVLTDLKLSGISGLELLKEIKEFTPNTGTLILTAYGDVNSYLEAMNLGAFDFLNKPVRLQKLEKVINRFLEERE